jgi:hypothetical protein
MREPVLDVDPIPRRFILQALDPDYGSPVLEALFTVSTLEELRALLGNHADDDPELRRGYFLEPAEWAAIVERFGVAFDPDGRTTRLDSWHPLREVPYLIHTGYELPLLLDGRKQFARMGDAYPPDVHFDEEYFDRYVAERRIHKEVVIEPFDAPLRTKDGRIFNGHRTVYYTRRGEEWRIAAFKLIQTAAAKAGWNEIFERLEGMLYGYEEWQIDWWIARHRERSASGAAARSRLSGNGDKPGNR